MALQPPPLDQAGAVVPHDHPEILAADGIIRRISEKQVVTDASGNRRISSIAFKTASENGGMSVDLERLIIEAGLDPKVYVTTPRWIGSVRFTAEALRAAGLKVGYNPLPENPYHGEVWGGTDKTPKSLANLAVWYVEMPGVALR